MADLRKLAEAATPGEWRSFDAFGGVSIWVDGPGASGDDDLEIAHMAEERPRANAAYIAAANPRAVIGLLDERDRLHDLVRHQRGPLHDAGLLTDEEYAALAADHGKE